jgi:hypothetical protein
MVEPRNQGARSEPVEQARSRPDTRRSGERGAAARSDSRSAKLAATMSLPMAVSYVLFTDVLDQITDTLEPIGFIMRNFNPGKVLKSNKEPEPIKPVSAEVVAQVCSIGDTCYIQF